MEYRFDFTARALVEASEAYDWIARDAPERAANWYQGLFDRIATLKTHPRRCALAREDDDFDEEIRQLLYGRRRGVYRILYTIREDTIVILSIRHGARGPVSGSNWEEDIEWT